MNQRYVKEQIDLAIDFVQTIKNQVELNFITDNPDKHMVVRGNLILSSLSILGTHLTRIGEEVSA